jgi:hypothetical protein
MFLRLNGPPALNEEKIMTQKRADQAQPSDQRKTPAADQTAGNQASDPSRTGTDPAKAALPPATSHPACDPHCVDVTGKTPEGIRIDPDITEGHPGYEESATPKSFPRIDLPGRNLPGERARPVDA